MARRIFVSYNFNDRELAHSIHGMSQENGGPVQGKFEFVTNDVARHGDAAIASEIKRIMQRCDAALFIVGDNSHNSPWINYEAQLVDTFRLRTAVTRHPKATGGVPHQLRRIETVLPWDPYAIGHALNNM